MRFSSVFRAAAALCLSTIPVPAAAQFWQCVTYAREATGMSIRGDARTWWGQAAGRYLRGTRPAVGAVMAMPATRAMPYGHVAVVARVLNAREVLLDHANWSRRGRIEHGVRAVDVSPAGDWSEVRIHYAPVGGLGTRVNPVSGFIYTDAAMAQAADAGAPVQLALLDR